MKISERYDKRSIIFRELLLLVEEITNGICFLALPIDQILTETEKSGVCKKLTFLRVFKDLTEYGLDFPDAWKEALLNSDLPLTRNEYEKIISFGLALGRTDSENQKNLLKLYFSQFSRYAEEAYIQRKRYYFTSFFTGLLFGGAIFILLI